MASWCNHVITRANAAGHASTSYISIGNSARKSSFGWLLVRSNCVRVPEHGTGADERQGFASCAKEADAGSKAGSGGDARVRSRSHAPRAVENHQRSVDEKEVAKFAAYDDGGGEGGGAWWEQSMRSPTAALHYMNRARGRFTRDVLCRHFSRDTDAVDPLRGLRVLDVGCGGGIFSESLARSGADVTGIDATPECVRAAQAHLDAYGTTGADISKHFAGTLQYRCITAEQLTVEEEGRPKSSSSDGAFFDAVVSLEVVEHVSDVEKYLETLCGLVRPGGALVMSTINRTPRSYALAILVAEEIMRWVPRGTHDWNKFVTPEEIAMLCKRHGVEITSAAGMDVDLSIRSLRQRGGLFGIESWKLSKDLSVNFIVAGSKAALAGPVETS